MSDFGNTGGQSPPGWYADPQVPGQQRWWDGTQWTEHVAPLTPTPTATGYGGVAPAQQIDPWLWQSIVATILCCQPLGIVGIVFASQSQSAMGIGDYATARDKARLAKNFTIAAASVTLGLVVLWFLFVALSVGVTAF